MSPFDRIPDLFRRAGPSAGWAAAGAALVSAFAAFDLVKGAAAGLGAVGLGGAAAWWIARQRATLPPPPSTARELAAVPVSVFDALPDPVVLLDANRVVLAANAAARDLLPPEPAGADLALALRHPGVLACVDAVLAGEPARQARIDLPVPVARAFQVHAVGLPSGRVRAVLALHDLTLATRAERMRADFVANVSHELRSPLSALVGFIETLQGPAREDANARAHFLDIMRREAERMTRLIGDLLSLTRVEVNEHVQPRDPVDIARLLRDVAEVLEGNAAKRGMSIELVPPGELPPVAGDADQLSQVFQNLLDNALKYGHEGTAVTVEARAVARIPETGGPGVAVAVRDRGEGIAAEHVHRLTERFYRVDKARSRSVGGTGLGLAIVKHIVSRHRGRLTIESVEGEGSTFTVFLRPAAPGRALPAPSQTGRSS